MAVRPCRCPRRDDRGASAVEFALVMPFLLLLVFGLIQYGLWFWAIQGGADAARHAGRLSAVGNPAACADFRSQVQGFVGGYASSTATVTRSYKDAVTGVAVADIDVQPGDIAEVTVQFNAIDLNFPFVPFIDDGVVSETVEARVDNVPETPESCS